MIQRIDWGYRSGCLRTFGSATFGWRHKETRRVSRRQMRLQWAALLQTCAGLAFQSDALTGRDKRTRRKTTGFSFKGLMKRYSSAKRRFPVFGTGS
ncbi:MAG: hypothetical protein LBF60_01635 [Treponema sp.]|nr:hypothetical protein [Treponema sp.]